MQGIIKYGLVSNFNEVLQRLGDAFTREAEFTSAASHELRTPITVIMAQADIETKNIMNWYMKPSYNQGTEAEDPTL